MKMAKKRINAKKLETYSNVLNNEGKKKGLVWSPRASVILERRSLGEHPPKIFLIFYAATGSIPIFSASENND
jgi:hypothetical protein